MTASGDDADIDWSLTTWEGNRREQLRRWRKLTLRQRLETIETMNETVELFARARREGRLRSSARPKATE